MRKLNFVADARKKAAMLENGWKVIWCNVRMELH